MIKENFEAERWCLYGSGDGVVWLYRQNQLPANALISINFNRPSVIKDIIIYFLDHGWYPENNARPLEIKDALKYLDIIDLKREDKIENVS